MRVHIYQIGLEGLGFVFAHAGKRGHDDQIAHLHVARCAAVERDDAAAFFGTDGVGAETRTIGDVPDVDLFEFADAGRFQQQAVDGDRALVVELGVGDGGAVDLGFQQGQVHVATTQRKAGILAESAGIDRPAAQPVVRASGRPRARPQNSRLSISRVLPIRAAISATRGPAAGAPKPSSGSLRSGRRSAV